MTTVAKRLPRPIVFERVDYADVISYFLACAMADRRPPPFGFIRRHIDLEPTGHLTSARIEWHHEVDFLSEAHELARSIGKELAFEENLWESSEFDGRYVLRELETTAEAVQLTGPYSIHGDHGRATQRLTYSTLLTVDEAQRTADGILSGYIN